LRVRWEGGSITSAEIPVAVFHPVSESLTAEPQQPLRLRAQVWGADAKVVWRDTWSEDLGDGPLRESWAIRGVHTPLLLVERAEFITVRDVAKTLICQAQWGEQVREVAVYQVTGKAPRPRLVVEGSGAQSMALGVQPLCSLYDQLEVGIVEYRASGLPPGLAINPDSGSIEGAPTRLGTYTTQFSVLDLAGRVTRLTHTFRVFRHPQIDYPAASRYSGVVGLESGLPEDLPPLRGFCTVNLGASGVGSGVVWIAGKRQSFRVRLRQPEPDLSNRAGIASLAAPAGLNRLRLTFSQPGDSGRAPITCFLEGRSTPNDEFSGDESQLYPHLKPDARARQLLNGPFHGRLKILEAPADGLPYPSGYGWLRIMVKRAGTAKITGLLPDGSALVSSGPLLDTANGSVACSFFKTWKGHHVQGLFEWPISSGEISPSVGFAGALQWTLAPQANRPTYPEGIQDASITLAGGRYFPSRKGQPVLPQLSFSTSPNADLVLDYTGLDAHLIADTAPASFPLLRLPLSIGSLGRLPLPAPAHGVRFTKLQINSRTGTFVALAQAGDPAPPLAPLSLSARGLLFPNTGSTLAAGLFLLPEPPDPAMPGTLLPIHSWSIAITPLGEIEE